MMQLNIFATVAPLLKEMSFDYDTLGNLETFLKRYKSKEILYPAAMQQATNLEMRTVYDILEKGVAAGVFHPKFEVYCPFCQRFSGEIFDSVFDIPEEVYCVHCDAEITHPIEYTIVVYEVL